MMVRITYISAIIVLALAGNSTAFGQITRVPRYSPPAGATMPRALDYFRQDVGALDPYNTFVAPRRALDRNLQNLQTQEDLNSRRAQQDISQIRQSTAAPTGTGGTFMNYSHYYSRGNQAGGGGQVARAPRSR